MNSPGYIRLEEVVLKYIDRAELNTSRYRRLYAMAIDCVMTEMNLDVQGVIKTCKIPVLDNMTAELPQDYIKWSKVGKLNANGEVAVLDYNPQLTMLDDLGLDRLETTIDGTNGGVWQYPLGVPIIFGNYYMSGYGYYNLYGVSGAALTSLGYFKVDEKNGIILLEKNYDSDYIILEYLSQPDYDDDFEVPLIFQEPIIAWLGYKDIEFKAASRTVSIYDKERRFKEWLRQKRLAKERVHPFRLQIANQYNRETTKLVPKA